MIHVSIAFACEVSLRRITFMAHPGLRRCISYMRSQGHTHALLYTQVLTYVCRHIGDLHLEHWSIRPGLRAACLHTAGNITQEPEKVTTTEELRFPSSYVLLPCKSSCFP